MGDLTVLDNPADTHTRRGRPTLYNPALGQTICDHIERGLTKRAACALCEVSEEVFQLWSQTREDFITMLARAEGIAEQRFTEALLKGAEGDAEYKGDPRMAVEWLKRRRRADYGDTLDVRKLDDETILRLLHAQQQQEVITEDGLTAIVNGADDI